MINNYDSVDTRYSTGSTSSLKQEDNSYTAKKRTWLSFITLFVALMSFVFAQGQSTANYAFSTSSSSSLIDISSGSTQLVGALNDDTPSGLSNIGFPFIFMGGYYTQYSVSPDGFIRLGGTAAAAEYTNSSTSTSNLPKIYARWDDSATGTNGYVRSKLIGSAPNRQLVIEWFVTIPRNTAGAANATHQVVLNETSGVIQFIYGNITDATASYSVGFTNTATQFTSVSTSSNAVSYVTANDTNSAEILSGRSYTFTPPAPASGPTGLTFASVAINTMTLNWTAAADLTNVVRYIVLNSTNGGTTYNFVANVALGTNTYNATGLTPGTTYDWKVVAVSEGVESTAAVGTQATVSPNTYYWIGASTDTFSALAKWNTAADGSGTTPTALATTDVFIIDGNGTTPGGATTINFSGAISVGQIKITNSTAVTFQSSATTQRIITVTGGPSDDFVIENGSSLLLTNITNSVSVVFSGTGNTGNIAGTLTVAGASATASSATANSFRSDLGTSTVVTVASTGVINNTATTNITTNGNITGTASSLVFTAGSQYIFSGAITTSAIWIPLATWDAASTVTISSSTATNPASPANNVQSFGNFVVNLPSLNNVLSFWTTSTTAVIKGNLVITAAGATGGTGVFRATTGTGLVTINGNVTISQGKFQATSTSTGTVVVNGDTTIDANGVLELSTTGSGGYSQRGNTLTNNGVLTGTSGTLQFLNSTGSAAQTLAGSGTVLTNLATLTVQNTAGLSITHTNPVIIARANLFQGTITGSNKITFGTGAAVNCTTQIGATGLTTAGGSFDATPTFNLGTGTYALIYAPETVSRTVGYEVPSTRSVNTMSLTNANGLVLAGGGLSTGTLTFGTGCGNITTDSTNLLTVTGATTTSIVRTSTTAYVNGPLAVTLPANLLTGSVNTFTFPIGKGSLNPFEIVNPVTASTGTVTVKAEVFDASTGGTSGTLMGALNSNRYWAASITNGAANFTSSLVKLNDAPNGADAIANSATLTGAYNMLGGLTTTATASSLTSTTPEVTTLDGFYVMGTKAAATLATPAITPSGNQCTNVSRAISVLITPGGGAITSVVLNYNINGVAQTAINMTNSTNNGGTAADTWIATIPTVTPTNANVTWSVTATDANSLSRSINGATYTDEPNLGVTASATATSSTTCAGDATTLSLGLNRLANLAIGAATTLTGATSQPTAFCNRFSGYRSQTVYTAAELIAAGLSAGAINSMTYNITTPGDGLTNASFTVKIGSTSLSTLTTSFESTSSFTTVYPSQTYTHTASGLQTITFSTPYLWDGVSNIIIDVTHAGANLTNNAITYYTATTGNSVLYALSTSATTGTQSTQRLNIIFNANTAPTPTSYSWSDGTTVVGTTSSLTVNPTATTTYTVTAIGNNCPLTASTTVTVNPLPTAPTTTASTQCGAGVPPATAADPNGFTAPTYKWYAAATGGVVLYSSTNATYGLPVSATTTLYVSVVNPTTNCESARTAVAITVNNADVLGISGAPTASVCLGQSFELTPTQTGSNGNVFALTWAPSTAGSGLTATTAATLGQAVTVTPTAAGTYTYSVNGSEASSGCTGAATSASITVINPNAGLSANATASSATVCSGSDTSLSLSLSNAAPSALYSSPSVSSPTTDEDLGNVTITQGATTILNNTTVRNSLVGTIGTATGTAGSFSNFTSFGPYALTAGQSYNFSLSSLQATTAYDNSMAIFIDYNRDGDFADANETVYTASSVTSGAHNETGSFTIPANAFGGLTRMRVICNEDLIANSTPTISWGEYEDYMLDITSTTSGGGASFTAPTAYSWSNGSTVVGTTNPAVVNPVNTTIYTGTATVNGCPISAATTVTTNPLPTALTAFNSNQCGLGVPTASVADNNGYTNPTIKWYAAATGGTALQSSTSTSYLTAINTTTTFYVSVADPVTNCESTRTAVTVSVIIPDVISATATPSTICLGQSIALAAANTATTPTQNYTYSWSSTTGSGLETPQSGATASVTPTAAGTYTYTITGIDGICTQINTVAVTVNPVPAIATASVDPTVACAGSTINLGATITGIAAGTSTVSGTGTSYTEYDGYPTFFGNYWRPDWSQMVYTAAELQTMGLMAGNITSITFNIGALPGPATVNNYSISLGSTTNDILTGFQTTGLTTVYGPVNHTVSAIGDVTINFSTPYNWDGTSNIIVDVRGTGQWASANATTQYTTTIDNTVVYAYSSPANPSFWTSNPTATTSTSRPNVKFGGQVLSNISSNYNWSWTAGSTSVLTTAAGTTILPVTSTTYTVTATNPTTGCTASQNFTVTANPLPSAPTATDSVQCGSQTPTASVTDPNNFSYPYINWYASATATTPLQSSISNTFSNTVSATTTFYVSVLNPATNCESPRTPVLVTVNIPDAVAANASPTTLCLGQTVTLTSGNTATTPTQNYTYSWSSTTDSGLENPLPHVNALATPTATGSYVYTVTATDVATTCVITNSVTVTVNPVPAITSATANPSIACAGSTIALEASIISVQAGTSTLGAGTTSSTTAGETFFPGAWGGAKTQYLIKASELSALGYAAGNITSIGFDPTTSGQTYTGFQLWVDQTTSSSLTTTFLPLGTQVYLSTNTDNAYTPVANSLNTLPFGTGTGSAAAFNWDGVSNLVLTFSWSSVPASGTSTSSSMYVDTPGYTCTAYERSDNLTPAAQLALTTADGTGTKRPNFTIGGQIATDVTPNYNWLWTTGSGSTLTNVLTSLSGTTTLPVGATTTYTVTGTNPITGCSSSQNVVVSTNIAPLAVAGVTTTSSSICIGSSTTLSAAPTGGCIPYSYSWSNGSSVVGTSATLTVSPTTTTTYTLTVTDNAGTIVTVPSLITVNNPQPTSVAGQTICANSAAFTLTATPSSTSNSVNWFADQTSTAVLSTSSSFTTPVLTAPSTTYYVEERANDPELSGNGLGTSTVPNSTFASSERGIVFTATKPFKLVSAEYYSASTNVSNTVSVRLVDDATGTQVASTNVTVPQGATASWYTMNINFDVVPGTYRLLAGFTSSVNRSTTGFTYPYTLGTSGSITSGYNFGIDSASYNYFHNITIQEFCAGTRVPVTATLNAPPALAISGATTTICEADSTVAVSVTTGAADYDQYTWSPATGVTSGTNGWTFNPTTTTTYTLTASQSAGTCSNTAAYVVNVNPLPSAITITPAAPSICVGDTQMLTAAGGLMNNVVILSENFNASSNSWTAINNSTGGTPANSDWTLSPNNYVYGGFTTFSSNDASQFYLSNSDSQGSGGTTETQLVSPSFSTLSYTNATLKFYQYYRASGTAAVEYSIDGGTNWVSLSSYTNTIGTSTSFVQQTVTLPAGALNQANVKVRFKYSDSYGWYWAVDNVLISGTQGLPITWSPVTDLYTNAAATIPYVAGANAATVYVKSAQAGSQTYTATAVSYSGCVRTATVPVIVNALPTVVTNAVSVCAPATVDLTAASVTAGSSTDITTLTYWTDAAATVALANPSAVAVSGTYYIVASNANGCSSSITPVTVAVNPLPVLTITNPATACFPATVDLTAAAVTAGSDAAGMTLSYFTDAAATTALATPAAVTTSGTYYIKITNNATGCNVISPVVVTIDVTSAPTGAAAQTFCGAANLSDLSVTGSNIRWYSAATGGVEYPASIWSAVGLLNGTTYYASQTVNGCESAPRIAVTVTINAIPSAPNASAQSFCGSATVADLVPSGSSLTWYDVAAGGSALTSSTALVSATYYVSQTSNGCEGTRTAVAVTVNGTALPTASAQTFCGPVTVASLVASGTSINWYDVATGGAALAGSTSLSTGTYYVTQTLNGCESPRLSVAVTVNTVAAPSGAAVQDACITETIADFVVTGDTGAVLTWYATSTSTTSIPTSTPAVLNSFYYVSQTVNGCEGPRLLVIASGPCLGNEEFDMTSFSYYPNPTRDIVNISYSKEITQIKVFNMLGQQVIDTKVNSTTTQVDLSRFATGTYFIEVTSDEVSKTVKVIKN